MRRLEPSPTTAGGLTAAIAQLLGCVWQRCTVHFLRDLLGRARKEQRPMVAALVRPIFATSDREAACEQLSEAVATPEDGRPRWRPCSRRPRRTGSPSSASRPRTGASCARPNPLERLNREIGRRTDVGGIFPNGRTIGRSTCVAIEQNDEWLAGRRYLSIARMKTRCRNSKRPEAPDCPTDDLLLHGLGLD